MKNNFRSASIKVGCACGLCAAVLIGGQSASFAAASVPPDAGIGTQVVAQSAVTTSKPVQGLEVYQDAGSTAAYVVFRQPRTGAASYAVQLYNITSAKVTWSTTLTTPPTAANPLAMSIPAKGKYAVRVIATNAAGASTPARAMIEPKIGPINMLQSGWTAEGKDYRLNLNWNAPNYSPFGRIDHYRIYNAVGQLLTETTDESTLLSVTDSQRLSGDVSIEPVAKTGEVGPRVTRAAEYPAPGESVSITNAPKVANAATTTLFNIHQSGFSQGDVGVIQVQTNGEDWETVNNFTVVGSDIEGKVRFTVPGATKLRVGLQKSGASQVFSDPVDVQVYDQQVTRLGGKVVNKGGGRFLEVAGDTARVDSGTIATVQVQRPGEGSFTTMGDAVVDGDKFSFKNESSGAEVTTDGTYRVRVLLPPAAEGLPTYISQEIQVVAKSGSGTSAEIPGSNDQVYSSVFSMDGSGNSYFTKSASDYTVQKLTPEGVVKPMKLDTNVPGWKDITTQPYAEANSAGSVLTLALARDAKTNERWMLVFEAKPGADGFTFKQAIAPSPEGESFPANRVFYGQKGELLITTPTAIKQLNPDGKQTVIAGTDAAGFSGDGGPAKDAQLNLPYYTAVAANGDIVFADLGNYRLRKIDAKTGVITTVAGNGDWSVGPDGKATQTGIGSAGGPTFGADGLVYFATNDVQGSAKTMTASTTIRRITADGELETVAGTGSFDAAFNPGAKPMELNLHYAARLCTMPNGDIVTSTWKSGVNPSDQSTNFASLVRITLP
jgi:hypothetical protein